jgi:hypothetical protein
MASPCQPATWLDGARAPHGPHRPLVRRGHLIASLIGHLIALIITGHSLGAPLGTALCGARIGGPPTLRDALSGLEVRSLPSDASDVAVAARADELIAGIFDL